MTTTKHYYVNINKSYVHIVQYGNDKKIIKQPDSLHEKRLDNSSKKLVIFIPGNPGMVGVYHDYLELLNKSIQKSGTRDENPVLLAISHNNCDQPTELDDVITVEDRHMNFIDQSIAKSHEAHNVELQVLNKLIILKQLLLYNLEDCQLLFIGHSIGCYVILRFLQDGLVASVHHGSIMIHPALENLAITEKGSLFNRYFDFKLDYVLKTLAFLAEKFLSESTRLDLAKRFFCSTEFLRASSDIVIRSLAQLCTMGTFVAMIEMAKSEFAGVKDLDHQLLIRPHVERLRMIYAIGDHWVNPQNREILQSAYPNLYIEEQPRMHAFIMEPKTVVEYAEKVTKFIQELLA